MRAIEWGGRDVVRLKTYANDCKYTMFLPSEGDGLRSAELHPRTKFALGRKKKTTENAFVMKKTNLLWYGLGGPRKSRIEGTKSRLTSRGEFGLLWSHALQTMILNPKSVIIRTSLS